MSLSVNDEAYRTRINSQYMRELSNGNFLIKHDQISQLEIIGQGRASLQNLQWNYYFPSFQESMALYTELEWALVESMAHL